MRLVCPNCGAQYEVDDRVIPENGRDVQCSACGHGWYQMAPGREDEETPAPDVDETLSGEDIDETDTLPDEEEPEDDRAFEEDDLEAEAGDEDAEEAEEPAPAVAGKPREIDEGVRSILREEADRELAARATEPKQAEQVETQPDLGLDSGPSPEEERRRIARERMARMRGVDEEELPEPDFDAHAEPEMPGTPAQGRDLFPDIEEINSTLDSHAPNVDAIIDEVEASAAGKRGFGRGFMLVLILAILLLTIYILAPKLVVNIPALEPVLTAYVEAVNSARLWLDEVIRGLVTKIEEAAGAGG